jgi:hypothetical protein
MNQPKYNEKNLYGETGHPQAWDVAQLRLGDCYLLAPMASLAYQQPAGIEKAVGYDPTAASFTVTLYKAQKTLLGLSSKPQAVNATVSQADIEQEVKISGASMIDRGTGAIEASWPAVMEAAYAKLEMKEGETLSDGFDRIGNAGWPKDAIYALTGERSTSVSDFSLRHTTLERAHARIDNALKQGRPVILMTRAIEGEPNDGLVTSDDGGGHAYAVESIRKGPTGNVTIKVRNPWGHNMDPTHGVSSDSPTVDVDLKTILENRHLQQIDFGPELIRRKGLDEATHGRKRQDDEKASVNTGDPYMDGLLESLGDQRAMSNSLHELAMSPDGRDFRTEGGMQYEELLHQQAVEESIKVQQQQQQQQQQAVDIGPVLSLGGSE